MAHHWDINQLAKCVVDVEDPTGQIKLGGHYIVSRLVISPCDEHPEGHLWLGFVQVRDIVFDPDCFVPVKPVGEEPKRKVREPEDA